VADDPSIGSVMTPHVMAGGVDAVLVTDGGRLVGIVTATVPGRLRAGRLSPRRPGPMARERGSKVLAGRGPGRLGGANRRQYRRRVPITVFLLDDHEIVRRGIAQLLESEDDIEVIGQAGTAAEALARIPALRPDVAILDVRLPDGDGVSVCRDVRGSVEPPPACLMLTSYSDDEALFSAIMAGAAGYLLKQVAGIDLVGAVRTIAAGGSLLDPRATALVLERLRKGDEPGDPRYASLSPQEQRILGLIADGLTNRQIGAELFLAEKTVKNYVSSLLSKLGLERRTQAAVFELEHRGD
jgi:DNA-binding NarL/FixJ family response regulator